MKWPEHRVETQTLNAGQVFLVTARLAKRNRVKLGCPARPTGRKPETLAGCRVFFSKVVTFQGGDMASGWRIDKDDVLGTNCLVAVAELLARTDRLEARLREGANVMIRPDLPRRVSLAAQHLRDWGLNAGAEEMMDRWGAFYSEWTRSTADYDESVPNLLGRFNQWLGDRLREWMISAGNTELLAEANVEMESSLASAADSDNATEDAEADSIKRKTKWDHPMSELETWLKKNPWSKSETPTAHLRKFRRHYQQRFRQSAEYCKDIETTSDDNLRERARNRNLLPPNQNSRDDPSTR